MSVRVAKEWEWGKMYKIQALALGAQPVTKSPAHLEPGEAIFLLLQPVMLQPVLTGMDQDQGRFSAGHVFYLIDKGQGRFDEVLEKVGKLVGRDGRQSPMA